MLSDIAKVKSLLGMMLLLSVGISSTTFAATSNQQSIRNLERLLDARNQAQLRLQNQVDDMGSEIDELRGLIEKNGYQIQQILKRQRSLYADVDKLSTQVEEIKKTPVAPVSEAVNPKTASAAYSTNADENSDYDHALNLLRKDRKYDESIHAFQSFLVEYPESTYSANAHYWLAQLYFSIKKDTQNAKKNFLIVLQFKDSSKYADSLLKLGLISESEGNKVEAKTYYEQVVAQYPKSETAERAEKYLSSL